MDDVVVAQPDGGTVGTIEAAAAGGTGDDVELLDELLIEEISIDGMCGVY